ncbi:MAG: hypothetical protein HKN29_09880 [Rhodothermales bacterium]|nr:hypothetical protein [Rhodothermales bacterium]
MRVDLAIVGGGFAGSLLASIARRIGLSVVLIDRGAHPRMAIGESSTPAGNMVLAALGQRYALPELIHLARYGTWKEHFPEMGVGPKRGFSYFAHQPGSPWSPGTKHANELLVAASRDALNCDTHWFRSDVDAFLFELAGAQGALLMPRTVVIQVERVGGCWQLGVEGAESLGGPGFGNAAVSTPPFGARAAATRIEARLLVDATGSGDFATRHLDVTAGPPMRTRTSAAFAHFEDLPTWQASVGSPDDDYPIPADQAAQHHVTPDGWMWQLRFDSGRTSVGIVGPRIGEFAPADWLRRYPTLERQFADAKRVWPSRGWSGSGPLQRRVDRAGGAGWILLPAAAGFVDPLHSTGIAHSLTAIERLARLLEAGVEDFSDAGAATLRELDHIDAMVAPCYAAKDFEAFIVASMVYFAASIHVERLRMSEVASRMPDFLGADVPALRQLAIRAGDEVNGPGFREWMARAIEPWNTAGLLDPEVPNMYPHTAPPGW